MEYLELGRQLVSWYQVNARQLPWRKKPDPYRIWISEIMLQQTKVDTAIPYFQRFIAEIPDVASLAAMDEERLLKLWEGLGYYSRCRNLGKAARAVVESYGGKLPETYKELIALPGIGPYTAGAISSICFNEPQPAVDGNVLRVIARVCGLEEDVGKAGTKKLIKSFVLSMMPKDEPGTFNQALMELGATVCMPNAQPDCPSCPWSKDCISRSNGLISKIPKKEKKKARRREIRTVFVVVSGNLVLIRKREESGLLSDLWEFPNWEGHMSMEEAISWGKELGSLKSCAEPLGEAKHLFSHIEWAMKGYLIELDHPVPVEEGQWVTMEDLCHRFAIPSAFQYYKKILLDGNVSAHIG